MSAIRRVIIGLLLALLAMPAFAASKGGAPGQFLSFGAGARSLGMGKAYTAVADDASATYWNPAAMVQMERKELQAMHVALFQDTNLDFVSYVHPTRAGTFGVNFTRLMSGGFEKVNVTIDKTSQEIVKLQKVGEFADVHQGYSFSYGRQFIENMSIGVSAKAISHQIDDFKQSFFALDTAFFGKNLLPNHRISLVAQNVVSKASAETDDRLPLTIKLGNAYSMLRDRITVSMDLTQSQFSGMGWNFGTEYWVMRWAGLRLGVEGGAGGIGETSAGFGLKYRNYSLDMAVALHELGISQRFSASWRFGRSVKSSQREQAKGLIEEGHELFRKGSYLLAIQKFGAALDVDPSNKQVQSMVAKLQDIVADLPKAPTGETGRLVASGVRGYMEGDLNTAYDNFRAAFDQDPTNTELLNLTNRIAKLAGKPLVETPKGAAAEARWTLVDQKLHDALQAIYEGRYDVAIQKCDEVLRIEPANVVAVGRMGASFFLLGEKDKAVALWKRALELDPSHRPAIEYLQQLGEYNP